MVFAKFNRDSQCFDIIPQNSCSEIANIIDSVISIEHKLFGCCQDAITQDDKIEMRYVEWEHGIINTIWTTH